MLRGYINAGDVTTQNQREIIQPMPDVNLKTSPTAKLRTEDYPRRLKGEDDGEENEGIKN